MADQFSLCVITAMDHLWFHHVILFPEPTSLLSKTLKPTSPSLSLSSPLDEVEELPSPLEDEEESSDSSPISTLQKDDSYCNEEEEKKDMNLKDRPTQLNLNRGRSNRSQFSLCVITAMDHLWFHHVILFPEPTSLLSKTLKPTSPSLSLSSPLDEVEELPSPLEDEEESSDSSPISTLQKDDSYSNEEEEEKKDMNLKDRPTQLNLNRGRSNRSQSSSPPTQKRPIRRHSFTNKLQKSMSCRSLMELELEEVKGFMDLGFRFNKEHLSPRMMSVLPGLQREKWYQVAKGYEIDQDGDYEKGKIRPYLSEAWLIKRPDSPLLKLKIPRVTSAADMKKHLKYWAKTVASAVQQQC